MPTPKQRILIVEDNLDLAEMMNAYFRVQNYEVMLATWGEDGLRLAAEQMPALILLDIRLPDIDGYEVCRQLRQSHRTRAIPVIFLTEKREREDKLVGLELGAVDYITKPFDITELDLRMRNALRRVQTNTTRDNPVTGLAEGIQVEEKLREMLTQEDWGVVLAGLDGIDRFRDQYGFVAADDVVRAVSVMLKHAMEETAGSGDFVGHVDAGTFLIITPAARAHKLADNCLARLNAAIPYFYPAASDRQNSPSASGQLTARVRGLTARDGSFRGLADLRAALAH
ncbi:MAG: response regulator [Anaerolineales bacterium]|nr:response regulator [Anaerolineales bacterium]MCB8953173.1 response regulator [Ardenticatenales bacterium]